MNDLRNQFVQILVEFMENNNINQSTLARMIGKSKVYTSRMVRGQHNISCDKMEKMAKSLGLKLELFAESTIEEDS